MHVPSRDRDSRRKIWDAVPKSRLAPQQKGKQAGQLILQVSSKQRIPFVIHGSRSPAGIGAKKLLQFDDMTKFAAGPVLGPISNF
jgi:hypothetical protein